MGAEHPTRSVDAAIAGLARASTVSCRGRSSSTWASAAARSATASRAARLHRVHAGVFAVGHRVVSRHGLWLAAVLACGDEAALSHRSAAALWGIRDTARADIDVTIASQRRRPGIRTHRIALHADEVTVERGIPVTNPARTLLDMAEVLTPHQLERAVHEAEYRRLTSPVSLDALIARHKRRRGTTALKAIVDRGGLGATITRSDFEAEFLRLLDDHGLPRPHSNAFVEGVEVDALWRSARLIVELDGRQARATATAFESDRARDRRLQARGYRVARITYRQLHDRPDAIADELRALLGWPVARLG